jgi:hypothetical protein
LATWAAVVLALSFALWRIPTLYEGKQVSAEKTNELPNRLGTPKQVNSAKPTEDSNVTHVPAGADRNNQSAKRSSEPITSAKSSTATEPTGGDPWTICPTDTDHFENTSSFPLQRAPQGEFGLTNGEFKMRNEAGSGPQRRCKYCPTTARRFRVGARMRMPSPVGTGGIYFLADFQATNGYAIEANAAGVVTLKRYIGDLSKTIWQGSTEPGQVTLGAEVTPTSIVAIVNGQRGLVVPIDPATLPSGAHQVGMILTGEPAEVYFDDLTLTVCE